MSTPLLTVTEGWTQELGPFVLKVDGTALALTGYTVSLVIKGRSGSYIASPSTRVHATQSGATTGYVYYTPASTDLTSEESPYTLHWKAIDGSSKVIFFPNTAAEKLAVVAP